MSFYGFNFQNNPQFSRLFGQSVLQNAQNAYNQGMAQFRPFDARANAQSYLEQVRRNRVPTAQAQPVGQPMAGLYIDNMGRTVNNTDEKSMMDYLKLMTGKSDQSRVMKYHRQQLEDLRTDPTKLGLRQMMTR